MPLQRINNGKTDVYQWENVPKAVVEGLEGTLNVPVSDTVNWTNNVTYMLQSKNKETGERLSIIPQYTLNSTLSWQVRQDVSLQSTFTGTANKSRRNMIIRVTPLPEQISKRSAHTVLLA